MTIPMAIIREYSLIRADMIPTDVFTDSTLATNMNNE